MFSYKFSLKKLVNSKQTGRILPLQEGGTTLQRFNIFRFNLINKKTQNRITLKKLIALKILSLET